MSSLNHPHICTLHDVGHQDGVDYLVMELVEGETLAHRLERGALPAPELLRTAIEIAGALDRAHRSGIVHRDLKPGNVMMTKSGAKLMDFGLARATGLAPAASDLTSSPTVTRPLTAEGTLVGTFQYMAPEQLEGKDADARSDLWALGCVLHEMATGRRAFEGGSQASLISAIMKDEPRPITELQPMSPAALERAVRRCLAKEPDDRWQSARDLMHELQWIRERGSQPPGPAPGAAAAKRELTYHALTFRRGAVMNARFALDGRAVVYAAAWDGGPSRVHLTRLESPETTELPLPPANLLSVSRSGELALSLNRRQLGTSWISTGLLAQAPLFGGAPRELLRGVHEADWAPDGRNLAVIRRAGLEVVVEFPIGKKLYASANWKAWSRISPDGERIAFFELLGGAGNVLQTIDRAGTLRTLAKVSHWPGSLAWRADGAEIWFTQWGGPDGASLRAVDLEGGSRTITRFIGGLTNLHDLSPSGDALVSRSLLYSSIACLPPDHERERDLSWLDLSIAKDLSADGQTLLFDEQGIGVSGEDQTFVRSTDGSPPVRLGRGIARSLSPDGRWAIVVDEGELTLLPTGADEARTVDTSPARQAGVAAWFPDGERILFQGTEEGSGVRLYVVPAKGGPPRAITPEGVGFAFGAATRPVSPDGTRVVAMAGGRELRIYDVESGTPLAAFSVEEDEEPIRWSADGRSVFLWRRGDVPLRVFRLDVETGGRERLMELMPADPTGVTTSRTMLLTPDGRAYAYTYVRQLSELYLVRGLA